MSNNTTPSARRDQPAVDKPRRIMKLCIILALLAVGVAVAHPGNQANFGNQGNAGNQGNPGSQGGQGPKEGSFFTNEAIRQAQNTYLIPKDATIQKVQEGVELAAYESIPGNQRIDLFQILGEHVPPEVVNNLQQQVDQVGKQ